MYDKEFVLEILLQIYQSATTILFRNYPFFSGILVTYKK